MADGKAEVNCHMKYCEVHIMFMRISHQLRIVIVFMGRTCVIQGFVRLCDECGMEAWCLIEQVELQSMKIEARLDITTTWVPHGSCKFKFTSKGDAPPLPFDVQILYKAVALAPVNILHPTTSPNQQISTSS
jgi:hypothetical protein